MIRRIVFGALAALCAATAARAGNSYPMVMSLQPVAIQAGTSAEMTVRSRYSMEGAYRVLISGNGVTGQVEPTPTSVPATRDRKGHVPRQERDRRENCRDDEKAEQHRQERRFHQQAADVDGRK